ncbi:TPA: hypothetical protein QEM39_003930 [Pseudomonas putida]|uniref:hypothetical protein n=1 Tax=Pseudomonas putida TaxID=303 RepID=UPI00236349FB|nr:hypothetical protein [Pseudomonas putida]MDD2154149.1 hypothetical protein [Pseudomonas putida]HDS1682349.1 hypothetical protein [Pseudomonas putida]
MTFNDTYTSREHRFALGIELTSQQCYLSIPVSNALVDYEEHYRIDKARYAAWLQDPAMAMPMVVRCRRRELDTALMMQPGTQRGVADPCHWDLTEISAVMARIAILLQRDGGYPSWANTFMGYRSRLHSEPQQVRLSVFAMPRGMGTLSDAVLYENGDPLVEATDELHALLGWLWEWGIEVRTTGSKPL